MTNKHNSMTDYLSIIDPTPYYNGFIDFIFPQPDDDIVLSKDEKNMIVEQIETVKSHLNTAKHNIEDENFDDAIEEVSTAIDASTCGKCQKKMLITAYDITHAQTLCKLDGERCKVIKHDINKTISEFINSYLPRVEDVLKAREN